MNVGEQVEQNFGRRQVVKDHDIVHGLKRCHQFCPAFRAKNRPALALECGYRAITVHSHHQHIAANLCLLKITHMADMEDIKTAVGKGDAAAFRRNRPPRARTSFTRHQSCAHELRMASVISPSETVAVPRFITTIPPA
jgi:hypothetical protein